MINHLLTSAFPSYDTIPSDSHKGHFGRALIVAGSAGMSGAAYMATRGAELAGAGLVVCLTPEEILPFVAPRLTGALVYPLSADLLAEQVRIATAVVFGCGMGQNVRVLNYLKTILDKAMCPVVIDADGLNVLSQPEILRTGMNTGERTGAAVDLLKSTHCPVIVTPHEGEMARLAGVDRDYIHRTRRISCEAFADLANVTVVLKGEGTLVSSRHEETYINNTGSWGMAKGGAGDILAGFIGGIAARGIDPYAAACAGVYLHGFAGDLAAQEKGRYSMGAEDVLEYLPEAVCRMQNDKCKMKDEFYN